LNGFGPIFGKTYGLSLLLYNFFLFAYQTGIRLASLWNPKAARWVKGREHFPVFPAGAPTIWMHCSSLGEFEQGRPVLEALRNRYPQCRIVLSFFSPSGYEIRKNYAGADQVIYLPMDSAANARRLLDSLKPSLVIWVKYEYWYYYLQACKQRQIPVLLVSAIFRPGQPFFKSYGALWRKMLNFFDQIFVQEPESAKLLTSIGRSANVHISGDTRFDRVMAIAEAAQPVTGIDAFVAGRPVMVAGSTWEEDEEELVHYVKRHPEICFILAPHEVDATRLAEMKKTFPDALLYSALAAADPNEKKHVLIIDSIGLLARLYRYADVTYIGGGFGDDGIHNTLEAAVYGKPVLFGPVYEKFAEAKGLVACGGAFPVEQALELESKLDELFSNPEQKRMAGEAAGNFVRMNRGATQQIIETIYEKRLLMS
jgi:3-deoxy-D-manno-octulosonic-acid transferase